MLSKYEIYSKHNPDFSPFLKKVARMIEEAANKGKREIRLRILDKNSYGMSEDEIIAYFMTLEEKEHIENHGYEITFSPAYFDIDHYDEDDPDAKPDINPAYITISW